jgi:hypothetical protein
MRNRDILSQSAPNYSSDYFQSITYILFNPELPLSSVILSLHSICGRHGRTKSAVKMCGPDLHISFFVLAVSEVVLYSMPDEELQAYK